MPVSDSKRASKANIEKISAEAELARVQADDIRLSGRPHRRFARAMTELAPTLAAVGTVVFSVCQWREQQSEQMEQKVAEQLRHEENLVNENWLALTTGSPAQRRAALIFFEGWIPEQGTEKQARALSTLGSTMAAENDSEFRNTLRISIIEIVGDEYVPHIHFALATALLSQNRALTESHSLLLNPDVRSWRRPRSGDILDEELDAARGRAQDTGDVIAHLVRIGFRTDFSGIYCSYCDFSGVTFDSGTTFIDSMLYRADFSQAYLYDARFTASDLRGANFRSANLENAIFTQSHGYGKSVDYAGGAVLLVENRAEKIPELAADMPLSSFDDDEWIYLDGPDFECANLRGSQFWGIHIFGLQAKKNEAISQLPVFVRQTNFSCAQVANADMSRAYVFGFRGIGDIAFPGCATYDYTREAGPVVFFHTVAYDDCEPARVETSDPAYGVYYEAMSAYLEMTDWSEAALPTPMQSLKKTVQGQTECECADVPEGEEE